MSLPSLAILAGGLATRLGSLVEKTPKSLLQVAGQPFIDHQLKALAGLGITEVVLCLGHLGEQVRDHVGEGKAWGLKISCSFDGEKLLGTGGALKKALPLLSDPFFTLYGDSYLELGLRPLVEAFSHSGKAGLMTVFKNQGQFDKSNVLFKDGRILAYDKKKAGPEMQHIDWGLGLLARAPLQAKAEEAFDLSDYQSWLASRGSLAGFEVWERFYEIGSEQGLKDTEAYLKGRS